MKERAEERLIARIVILGLLILNVYLLYRIFAPFLSGIAWAVFLATAFYPVHRKFVDFLKMREWFSAVLTTLLVAALIVIPAVTILSQLAQTMTDFFQDFPVYFPQTSAERGALVHRLLNSISKVEDFLGHYLGIQDIRLRDVLLTSISTLGEKIARQSQPLVSNTFRTLIGFMVMIVIMVMMFRYAKQILHFVHRALPLSDQDKDVVFERVGEMTRAIFYGVMLTALVQATLGFIGWMIAGLPAPLLFSIAMFFCAMFPFGGTSLIWGPGAVYLLIAGDMKWGFFLLLWGFLVVGMADNILRPIFISRRTRLHIVLVFFGIFGGILAFGPKGLFLGPLIITLFFFLLEVVRRDLFQQVE